MSQRSTYSQFPEPLFDFIADTVVFFVRKLRELGVDFRQSFEYICGRV